MRKRIDKQPSLFEDMLPAASRSDVVPLGKYKGQAISVLVTDPAYSIWMLTTLRARLENQYPELLYYLLQHFGNPEDTPEHNAFQARFLERDFALRFAITADKDIARLARDGIRVEPASDWERYCLSRLRSTSDDRADKWSQHFRVEKQQQVLSELLDDAKYKIFDIFCGHQSEDGARWLNPVSITGMEPENNGVDFTFRVVHGYMYAPTSIDGQFRVEIKPVMGDDYPVVMRTAKTKKITHLLVGEYCGVGATWHQVAEMFRLSRITPVLLADVENTEIPECFNELPWPNLDSRQAIEIIEKCNQSMQVGSLKLPAE